MPERAISDQGINLLIFVEHENRLILCVPHFFAALLAQEIEKEMDIQSVLCSNQFSEVLTPLSQPIPQSLCGTATAVDFWLKQALDSQEWN